MGRLLARVAAAGCWAAPLGADEPDEAAAVARKWEEAKAGYVKATGAARAEMVGAFDGAIKQYADRGLIEAVKTVETLKSDFVENGRLPDPAPLRPARMRYEAAKRALSDSYKEAFFGFSKLGESEQANAVDAEHERLLKGVHNSSDELDTKAFLDPSNWGGLAGLWKIQDGGITGSSAPLGLRDSGTFLCSKKKYRDFELSFRIRLTGEQGNSVIQIRRAS